MYIPPVNHTSIIFNRNSESITHFRISSSDDYVFVPQAANIEILKELRKILLTDKIKDDGQISIRDKYISLFDIQPLIADQKQKFENTKNFFETKLVNRLEKIYNNYRVIIHDFNYEKKELRIGFTTSNSYMNCSTIRFSKNGENLYLIDSETIYGDDVFKECKDILSGLYDALMNFYDFKTQNNYRIQMINSNLNTNISYHGVCIERENPESLFKDYFSLRLYEDDKIVKKINTSEISELVDGNEIEILKKSFVMINDCPKWMQKQLYEIRKNQIIEEEKLEEEKKLIELEKRKMEEHKKKLEEEKRLIELEKASKKEKRLELVKKIFPFIKK